MIREKSKTERIEIDGKKFTMTALPATEIDAFWSMKGTGPVSDHRARLAFGLFKTVTTETGEPVWATAEEPLREDFEVWNIVSDRFLVINGLATEKN